MATGTMKRNHAIAQHYSTGRAALDDATNSLVSIIRWSVRNVARSTYAGRNIALYKFVRNISRLSFGTLWPPRRRGCGVVLTRLPRTNIADEMRKEHRGRVLGEQKMGNLSDSPAAELTGVSCLGGPTADALWL